MRVLVVNSSLRVGGAESMSVELANALASAGVDVGFAAAGGPLRDNLSESVDYIKTSNPNDSLFKVAGELAAHLKEKPASVVHSHGGMAAMAASIASKRVKPHPARVLTHHSRLFRRAPQWMGTMAMRRVADHFVAISHDKVTALTAMKIPPARISHIPNFIDTIDVQRRVEAADTQSLRGLLGIEPGARVVCIAGRVLPAKGFDRFVRILERTAQLLGDELHGVAVGDGPVLDEVKQLAADVGGAAQLHFPGYQRDVFPFLAISDVVLFPSSHPEVLPMFLIEASAAGVPVVCSDIAGNRDIIEHEGSGVLCEGGDEVYVEQLIHILGEPDRAVSMGKRGREIARERFDRSGVIAATLQMYRSFGETS